MGAQNSTHFRLQNLLPDESVEKVADLYPKWQEEEGLSRAIDKQEAVRNDCNLSRSRYAASNDAEEVLPLEDTIVQPREAEEQRAVADRRRKETLRGLGLDLDS